MSRPEREQHWSLFKDCGISREEFNNMNDEEFSQYLNFLSASLSTGKQNDFVAFENDMAQDDQEEMMTLEEQAKKLAKKCEKCEIEDFIKDGESRAKDFLDEVRFSDISLTSILAADEFPPEKNPAFSGADFDSQGKF